MLASAVDLVNRAAQALHGIQVGGVFADQASRLESIAADLADVVFALVQELDGEGERRGSWIGSTGASTN